MIKENIPLQFVPLCWNLSHHVGIRYTTLKTVPLRWNLSHHGEICPTPLERVLLCLNVSHFVWICPILFKSVSLGLNLSQYVGISPIKLECVPLSLNCVGKPCNLKKSPQQLFDLRVATSRSKNSVDLYSNGLLLAYRLDFAWSAMFLSHSNYVLLSMQCPHL